MIADEENAKKDSNEIIEETLEDNDEEVIEIIENNEESIVTERITLPVMSIYEKSNLITERVKQLENNFKSLLSEETIKTKNLISSFDIAIEEFETKNFPPISIKRKLPNGNYEIWNLKDFEIIPE